MAISGRQWYSPINGRRDRDHPELHHQEHSAHAAVFCALFREAAASTRNQLLPKLARENVLIAGPHMPFPALGRLRQEGSGYSWAPVIFTDQWDEK